MFNDIEIEFIETTAKRDLEAVKSKIQYVIDDLARYGKNLSDLKVTESKLMMILESVSDYKKENE